MDGLIRMRPVKKRRFCNRAYDVKPIRSYGIYSFRVLSVFDAARLDKYDREVSAAVDAFWMVEHAKRMQAARMA